MRHSIALVALTCILPLSAAASETPPWLLGSWTREWIQRDGNQSNPREVHYIQVPKFFADVRIPVDRKVTPSARSFDDLSDADLRELARQQAFTGWTSVQDATSTWHHDIDFEPPDGFADVGRVEQLEDGHILEHGTDGSYTESWRRSGAADGPFLVIRVQQEVRIDRVLLVAGDYFLYIRNRAVPLPPGSSFAQLLDATPDRATRVRYLDCEFSYGQSRGGSVPWEIQRSTLPWLEGKPLDFVNGIVLSQGRLKPAAGSAVRGEWSVPVNTLSPAQLARVFPSAP
jgi:hypothetical protein